MSKKIDLNRSVYDITKTYPEVIDIMVNLGFDEIKKPAMLNSVGRIMTIPKGAKSKGISIPVVIAELIKNGNLKLPVICRIFLLWRAKNFKSKRPAIQNC